MSARERTIAALLIAAIVGCAAFVAAYATGGRRLYEGLSLAFVAASFCGAAVGWAFWIVPDETVVDEIDTYPSPQPQRLAQAAALAAVEASIGRPRALVRLLYVALAAALAALAVPVRSLGPAVDGTLFHTRWRRGDRLVNESGTPMRVGDLNPGSAIAVFPESAPQDAQSQATLVRLAPGSPAGVRGYVAYSRICTHAGCPVALYRASAEQLLCPCHQSVFDVVNDGAVVSGPADHALPRLPIVVGADGYLRATGDFPVPVGPGFWERA